MKKKVTGTVNSPGTFEHFVQFYRTDEYFLALLTDYFKQGIEAGDVCIVIATKEHLTSIKQRLELYIDYEKAVQTKKYIPLDAQDLLSDFMEKNKPNAKKFANVIGGVVDMAILRGNRVRAFGEMVVLLWQDGNTEGAIALEKLWNNLGKTRNFSLLCSYPLKEFDGQTSMLSVTSVCDQHTKVFTEEVLVK
jgi:hypothetical protein